MRFLELVGVYQKEFAEHCKTLPSLVCAECGGSKIKIISTRFNSGVCLNKKCKWHKRCIALAPAMESIWGESGNTVLESGTGETSTGTQSASGKMWELHRKSPKGSYKGEVYEVRIYSVMEPDKSWLRDSCW